MGIIGTHIFSGGLRLVWVQSLEIKYTSKVNLQACYSISLCRKEAASLLATCGAQRKEPFLSPRAGTGSWRSQFLVNPWVVQNTGLPNPHCTTKSLHKWPGKKSSMERDLYRRILIVETHQTLPSMPPNQSHCLQDWLGEISLARNSKGKGWERENLETELKRPN